MKTKILIAAIMGALMLLILPAAADYSGDHPLVPVESGTINGDVLFLVEDGTNQNYLKLTEAPDFPVGAPKPNLTQSFDVSIPEGATVTSARLFNYYTWSRTHPTSYTQPGAPAEADITFSSGSSDMSVQLINPGGCDVTITNLCANPIVYDEDTIQYWDSSGRYYFNYPNGNIAMDVTDIVTGSDTYTATVEHASGGNTDSFVTYGFALLIVYEDTSASPISYWVTEGADVLYNKYGFTPEDATTEVLNPLGFNKGLHNMKILAAGADKPFKQSQQSLTEILLDGNKIQTFPLVSDEALSLYNKDVMLKDQYSNIFSVRDVGDYYTVFNAILVEK